jgi:aminopeptidase S
MEEETSQIENMAGLWRAGMAAIRARWYLRGATHLGSRVRIWGKPAVTNRGRMIIEERAILVSTITLEVSRGWKVDPDGTDTAPTATSGRFSRSDPAGTAYRGPKQLTNMPSGSKGFVTGAKAGSSAGAYDLDGRTTLRSPAITLAAGAGQRLTFRYVFAHSAASSSADSLRAIVEDAGGARTTVFVRAGRAADVDGAWRTASVSLDRWLGQTIRIRFEAVDGGRGNLVEAEIDDVRVTRPT